MKPLNFFLVLTLPIASSSQRSPLAGVRPCSEVPLSNPDELEDFMRNRVPNDSYFNTGAMRAVFNEVHTKVLEWIEGTQGDERLLVKDLLTPLLEQQDKNGFTFEQALFIFLPTMPAKLQEYVISILNIPAIAKSINFDHTKLIGGNLSRENRIFFEEKGIDPDRLLMPYSILKKFEDSLEDIFGSNSPNAYNTLRVCNIPSANFRFFEMDIVNNPDKYSPWRHFKTGGDIGPFLKTEQNVKEIANQLSSSSLWVDKRLRDVLINYQQYGEPYAVVLAEIVKAAKKKLEGEILTSRQQVPIEEL